MATIKLTTQDFKDKVFNYETEKDWKYQGELPAIIDFYADWWDHAKWLPRYWRNFQKSTKANWLFIK